MHEQPGASFSNWDHSHGRFGLVWLVDRWTRFVDVDVRLRVPRVEPGAGCHPAFLKQHYDMAAASSCMGGDWTSVAAVSAKRALRNYGLRAFARSGFGASLA